MKVKSGAGYFIRLAEELNLDEFQFPQLIKVDNTLTFEMQIKYCDCKGA